MKTIIAIILSAMTLFATGLYDYSYLVNSNTNEIDSKMDKHLMYGDFDKVVRFEPIFFDPSDNTIKEDSKEYLQEIIKKFEEYKERDVVITIIGYTDHVQTKTEEVNQSWWYPSNPNDLTLASSQEIALSYANDTYERLSSSGIPKELMIVEQRGGLDNLYTRATSEGRELNYRAMVSMYIAKDKNADSDQDGVIDSEDKCLFTPIKHPVDSYGCSTILNLTVYFDVNSPNIKGDSEEKLQKVTAFMKRYPEFKVVLYGHTSSEGTKLQNQLLSEKRALAVRKYLIKEGIISSKISAYGKASSEPVQSNDVAEVPELNRRVEIKLY